MTAAHTGSVPAFPLSVHAPPLWYGRDTEVVAAESAVLRGVYDDDPVIPIPTTPGTAFPASIDVIVPEYIEHGPQLKHGQGEETGGSKEVEASFSEYVAKRPRAPTNARGKRRKTTKRPRPPTQAASVRPPYTCKRCGQIKKGHACPALVRHDEKCICCK